MGLEPSWYWYMGGIASGFAVLALICFVVKKPNAEYESQFEKVTKRYLCGLKDQVAEFKDALSTKTAELESAERKAEDLTRELFDVSKQYVDLRGLRTNAVVELRDEKLLTESYRNCVGQLKARLAAIRAEANRLCSTDREQESFPQVLDGLAFMVQKSG